MSILNCEAIKQHVNRYKMEWERVMCFSRRAAWDYWSWDPCTKPAEPPRNSPPKCNNASNAPHIAPPRYQKSIPLFLNLLLLFTELGSQLAKNFPHTATIRRAILAVMSRVGSTRFFIWGPETLDSETPFKNSQDPRFTLRIHSYGFFFRHYRNF